MIEIEVEHDKLLAIYTDEISAQRAKQIWLNTVEDSFLLDYEHDFIIYSTTNLETGRCLIECQFISACGRYALRKIVGNKEIFGCLKRAHIPEAHEKNRLNDLFFRLRREAGLLPKADIIEFRRY